MFQWSRLELFGKRAESLKSSWKEQLQRLESQPSEAEMDSVVRNILDGVRAKCQEIIDGSKEERENAQQQAKSLCVFSISCFTLALDSCVSESN